MNNNFKNIIHDRSEMLTNAAEFEDELDKEDFFSDKNLIELSKLSLGGTPFLGHGFHELFS